MSHKLKPFSQAHFFASINSALRTLYIICIIQLSEYNDDFFQSQYSLNFCLPQTKSSSLYGEIGHCEIGGSSTAVMSTRALAFYHSSLWILRRGGYWSPRPSSTIRLEHRRPPFVSSWTMRRLTFFFGSH